MFLDANTYVFKDEFPLADTKLFPLAIFVIST